MLILCVFWFLFAIFHRRQSMAFFIFRQPESISAMTLKRLWRLFKSIGLNWIATP